MAVHICRTKTNAKKYATRARAKGYNANVYGRKVSVTRK